MAGNLKNGLHLPDISIRNFRGVKRLSIGRLGHVTLLVGRNGAGKSTVLEAMRVYAARASPSVLNELLNNRLEISAGLDTDRESVLSTDYAALFHGRTLTGDRAISIGPKSGTEELRLEVATPADWSDLQMECFADLSGEADMHAIKVLYRDEQRLMPWVAYGGDPRAKWIRPRDSRYRPSPWFYDGRWPIIRCESLGPGLPDNMKLARFWDRVALTEAEDLSLQALRLAVDGIERVALIGGGRTGYRGSDRHVVVKLKDHARPLPLESLGDGATRLFAAGLAFANCRDGLLVIDEAENGIHYSIQRAFWSMLLKAAHEHNVQVIATTHSHDCVIGFAYATAQAHGADGVLVRLERYGNQVRAVEYTEEDIVTAAEQHIEVR